MNYYKHHLGDYAGATRHLSLLEHGVLRSLIDIYYITEKPIPADIRAACRLICARSDDEVAATEIILSEFFVLGPDGWRNSRCDEEIQAFAAKSEKNRELGKLGGRPRKQETQTVSEKNPNGFQDENRTVLKNNPSHKPIANSHYLKPSLSESESTAQPGVDQAGAVCARLREEARIPSANPQHPKLLALLAAGLTADEIVAAGMDAKGRGFAWVLAAAEGRRRDAASVLTLPNARDGPINGRRRTAAEEREAVSIALTGRKPTNERQIANPERDITGESTRIA